MEPHLLPGEDRGYSPNGGRGGEAGAPARKRPPSAGPASDGLRGRRCGPWRSQRTAIDALPEIELRRLLSLIGGMDPAALQRAAAAYTETFCAVAEMKASVAALRPVALLPCNCPQDPGQGSAPSEPLRRPEPGHHQ